MDNNEKKKYIWGMFLPLIVIYLVELAVEIFAMQVIFVYKISSYREGTYLEFVNGIMDTMLSPTVSTIISIAFSLICTGILGYLYGKHLSSKDNMCHPFRNLTDNLGLFIVGMVIFAVGMQFVCTFLSDAIAAVKPDWYEEYEKLLNLSGFSSDSLSVGLMIYGFVLAPICEELAFRGVTFKSMCKVMTPAKAIVLQAAFFALFHQNKFQATFTFVVGLGLGYIMYMYNNLTVTIIIHMIFNMISGIPSLITGMGTTSFVEYFFWFLGSLIFAYAGILLLQKAVPGVKN